MHPGNTFLNESSETAPKPLFNSLRRFQGYQNGLAEGWVETWQMPNMRYSATCIYASETWRWTGKLIELEMKDDTWKLSQYQWSR